MAEKRTSATFKSNKITHLRAPRPSDLRRPCLRCPDHTREYGPILAAGPRVKTGVALGTRATFADVGATVEALFDLEPKGPGESFAGVV